MGRPRIDWSVKLAEAISEGNVLLANYFQRRMKGERVADPTKPLTAKQKLYNKVYHQQYRANKGGKSSQILTPESLPIQVYGERPTCAAFGCGRPLSLIESLAGNYHFNCQPSKTDPVRVVKL